MIKCDVLVALPHEFTFTRDSKFVQKRNWIESHAGNLVTLSQGLLRWTCLLIEFHLSRHLICLCQFAIGIMEKFGFSMSVGSLIDGQDIYTYYQNGEANPLDFDASSVDLAVGWLPPADWYLALPVSPSNIMHLHKI